MIWFFFGLMAFLFGVKMHRVINWEWDPYHTPIFLAIYAFAGLCAAISGSLCIYGVRGLKARFSLRGLIGLVAVAALVMAG